MKLILSFFAVMSLFVMLTAGVMAMPMPMHGESIVVADVGTVEKSCLSDCARAEITRINPSGGKGDALSMTKQTATKHACGACHRRPTYKPTIMAASVMYGDGFNGNLLKIPI